MALHIYLAVHLKKHKKMLSYRTLMGFIGKIHRFWHGDKHHQNINGIFSIPSFNYYLLVAIFFKITTKPE